MKDFNLEKVYVYKTYQMYRIDSFETLIHDIYERDKYKIGCKMVRGAYYKEDQKYKILYKTVDETHRSL